MNTPTTAHAGSAPVLGERRARVLALLQDAGQSLGVDDVAAKLGLHPNTARFHLDGLVDAGLVDRTNEETGHPGRPRGIYTARPGAIRAGQRSYHLLAEILTNYIANREPRPSRAALQAGRAWGTRLAHQAVGSRRSVPAKQANTSAEPVSAASATRQLVAMLDDVGFAPEVVNSRGSRKIRLHHCPFREAAIEHQDVVCAVHLGLMQGMLSELDAPLIADRLEPFVEPSLCVAHVSAAESVTQQ
jgi:predicted ArsR family transcriptional regulator